MSSLTVPPPDAAVGALLIGSILGAISFGFTSAQGFLYYQRSVRELWSLRLYVLALWAIDGVNTAFLAHSQYTNFVTNYANPASFMKPVWSLVSMVLLTAIVSFMVRGMLIRSVWQMSYAHPVPSAVLSVLSLVNLVCGILMMVKTLHVTHGTFEGIKAFIYLDLGSAILADISLAATLFHYLNASKIGSSSSNGFKLNTFILWLQIHIVGTGMLTVIIALTALILYAAMPDKYVFLAPFMLWSKFYTNALFTSLNTRKSKPLSREILAVNLSTGTPPRWNPQDSGGSNQAHSPQVTIQGPQVDLRNMQSSIAHEDMKTDFSLGKGL